MHSAPGIDRLPLKERRLFVEQFEKDLKFIQLFFLLMNKTCPIKNIDLVWAEREPSGRASLRHLGTVQALGSSASRLLSCREENPHPAFCNIVNDFGRHEADSCGVSDQAAAERTGGTGRAEVYRCHFGLVDIAAPVVCDGWHIATLYSGQVLREAPSKEGFEQVARDVAHLSYIDLEKLEKAYWSVRVVGEQDIQNATELLEIFAEYLANSWTRLAEVIRAQQQETREQQLARIEFACLVLEGGSTDRADLQDLTRRLGFTRYPNRVLVVKPETEEEYGGAGGLFDLGLTSAIQAVDDLCEKLDDVIPVHLRKRGICVFFNDQVGRNREAGDFHASRLAKNILHAIGERGDMKVRVGIGNPKHDWRRLADSYQEACVALVGSTDVIAAYTQPSTSFEELSALSDRVCRAIAARDFEDAKVAIASLPYRVSRRLDSNSPAQQSFFASSLNSMAFAARKLGADAAAIRRLREEATVELDLASNSFQLQESYLRIANEILREARRPYSRKRDKIIERACRTIERRLEHGPVAEPISISSIAAAAGVSVSYLSRTFRRVTGETFEHYVMRKRVELAQRFLLEPSNNIAEVAGRCGFSDASYFARVFRKITGCSPREYCDNPLRLAGSSAPEPNQLSTSS